MIGNRPSLKRSPSSESQVGMNAPWFSGSATMELQWNWSTRVTTVADTFLGVRDRLYCWLLNVLTSSALRI